MKTFNMFVARARLLSASLLAASLVLMLLPRSVIGVVHESRRLIIGGAEAPEGRYAYAVSLKDSHGTHYCGGSLISKTAILTAAHCVAFADEISVTIGRHNLTDETVGDEVPVGEIIAHPKYDMRSSEDYDIAVMILSRPTTADVDVVRINSDPYVPVAGEAVTYLGWGEIDTDHSTQNTSDVLMEVESNVITNQHCDGVEGLVDGTTYRDTYRGMISDVMLCTFSLGKDSCQKDSGGPLIVRGESAGEDLQVGVASWGLGCASLVFPGVACRISYVYDWIQQTVCKKSVDPDPAFGCDGDGGTHEHSETPHNLFIDEGNEEEETVPISNVQIERPAAPSEDVSETTLIIFPEREEPEATSAADPSSSVEGDAEMMEMEMPKKPDVPRDPTNDFGRTDTPGDPTNDFGGSRMRNGSADGKAASAALCILASAMAIQIMQGIL